MVRGKVTIKDVAQEAGVSIATVYRAVNDKGRISTQTQARILETVDRLGYKANAAARGLALRRHFCILVVLPTTPPLFWDDVRKGVRRAAAHLSDYRVEILECYHDQGFIDGKSVLCFLAGQAVDAIVLSIVNLPESQALLQYANEHDLPVATINEDPVGQERLFFYGPDNRQAGSMAAELVTRFCSRNSRVGIIHTQTAYACSTHDYRCQGFLADYKARHKSLSCDLYACTAKDVPRRLLSILQEHPDTEALYFDQYATLLAACETLTRLKIRPKVVGHEYNSSFAPLLRNGTITALLVQEKVCQGYHPVMMMYRYLAGHEKPARSHYYSNINIIIENNMRFLHQDDYGCGYE
ncbi:MAG: LacI family transcriptional regulator [Ruminococcaceae bacterium]|nr:LacI family transcriptional regulator [Oscillospiraceae bacterium]